MTMTTIFMIGSRRKQDCMTSKEYVIEKDDDGNIIEEHYLSDDDLEEMCWMEWTELRNKLK